MVFKVIFLPVCGFIVMFYKLLIRKQLHASICLLKRTPSSISANTRFQQKQCLIRAYIWKKILLLYQYSVNISYGCLLDSLNELCLRAKGILAAERLKRLELHFATLRKEILKFYWHRKGTSSCNGAWTLLFSWL